MKTKTVMIERRVAKGAAKVVWEMIQGSIALRPKARKEGYIDALDEDTRRMREIHKALKAASKEGTAPRGTR